MGSYIFCSFVPTSAKNVSLLKQFTYLKSLIMHFQKLALFIMLWLTVSDIFGFEFEYFCWGSDESLPFLIF